MKFTTRINSLWIPPTAVTAFSLVFFGASARLDPEPYHDGSQLPAAIGVADGLRVHEDVFSAYGFLTAWLQGMAVEIFGAQLLVIRFWTSVVSSVVALLIFLFTRYVTASTWISFTTSLVWVVTWPGMSVEWGTPFLPWPSNLFLVWQLSATFLVAHSLLSDERRKISLFAAGSLITLAVLTRLNYGTALALALLISALIFARRAGWRPKDWGFLAAGVSVTIFLPVILLLEQRSVNAFIDQSIIGALKGEAIVKPTEWFYIENGYLWGSFLLLITLLLLWLASTCKLISPKFFILLTCIATLGLTIWASAALPGSAIRETILSKLTWAPAIDIQAMQPLYLIAVLTVLAFLALLILLVKNLLPNTSQTPYSQKLRRSQVLVTLLTTTSAASLIQLYPVADPNHLWWAAPLPLIFVVYAVSELAPQHLRNALLAVLLLPPLLIAPFTAWAYFSSPRIELRSNVSAGMLINPDYADAYAQMDRLLSEIDPRSAQFLCKEGLFSVWDGEYLASGPGYVDYAYELDSASTPTESDTTILCLPWGSRHLALTYSQENGLTIADETDEISLSYFSDVQVFRLEGSPK